MRFEYLWVLLVSVVFPAILSAHPSLRLYRYPQSLIKAIGIPSLFYWAWDLWAVARGHWSFHPATCWVSASGVFLWRNIFSSS